MELAAFRYDAATGVHLAPGLAGQIAYADGSERALAALLGAAQDRSSTSDELMAAAPHWPLSYHVSPYRWTLLDALGLPGRATSVLELGAGCGALTRWLGERFAAVTAIEGSASRAALARLRCAGLDGVGVYAGDFMQTALPAVHDVATLIGVLEYSGVLTGERRGGAEPALATLRHARAALRDPGLLVIAIENRIGLRYLLGAPEDHTGRPYEGVQGYPRPSTAVTYSRQGLEALVREAGFEDVRLVLPFPDYKLPALLVDPANVEPGHHLENWLAASPPGVGSALPRGICRALAQREMVRGGVAADLADSFVLVATTTPLEQTARAFDLDLDWSARHYALRRRSGLRKRVTLRPGAGNPTLAVEGYAGASAVDGALRQRLGETFTGGTLLVFDVLETLAAEGMGARFQGHVRAFADWLQAQSDDGLLGDDAVDLVWWNVVVDADTGAWTAIDREWRLPAPVPVTFVVWRMLRHFATHYADALPAWCAAQPTVFATVVLGAALPAAPLHLAPAWAAADTALARTIAPGYPPQPLARALEALTVHSSSPASGRALVVAARSVYGGARVASRARRLGWSATRHARVRLAASRPRR